MTPSREYLDLLGDAVACLAKDAQAPLMTTGDIVSWLHEVTAGEISAAIVNGGGRRLLRRFVSCILTHTRHPLLSDWSPEQIADWCRRVRAEDVHFVLYRLRAA